jgi:hypothetical protein
VSVREDCELPNGASPPTLERCAISAALRAFPCPTGDTAAPCRTDAMRALVLSVQAPGRVAMKHCVCCEPACVPETARRVMVTAASLTRRRGRQGRGGELDAARVACVSFR